MCLVLAKSFPIQAAVTAIQPLNVKNRLTLIDVFSLTFFLIYLDCLNALPVNVKQSSSLTSFKRQMFYANYLGATSLVS